MMASAKHIGLLAGISLMLGSFSSTADVLFPSQPAPARTGEVYLLRGLVNVFSTGLDALGAKMRSQGFYYTRIHNHTLWKSLADDILRRAKTGGVSYPVIIIGHSYGADACAQMATYLGEHGVPVAYAVTFDPSHNGYAGPNIAKFVNYYVSPLEGVASNNVILKGKGFNGTLENINVPKLPEYGAVVHLNVEKNPRLHGIVLQNALSLTKLRVPNNGQSASRQK